MSFCARLGSSGIPILTACLTILLSPPAFSATISWLNPADGDWSVGANWAGGQAPGPLDTAEITVAGTYTVTLDTDVSVDQLVLGNGSDDMTLAGDGQSLTVGTSATIRGGSSLELRNGALDGTGSVQIDSSGSLELLGTAVVSVPVDNAGVLLATRLGNRLSGVLTTQPGSQLRVDSTPSNVSSDLTIDDGFTNNGTIVLVHNTLTNNRDDRLIVTSGTLVNAAGGIITSAVGTNRGTRTLTAQLDNQGTVNVEYPLTLNGDSADHSNSGTINVNRDLTVQQTGTTPSFLHTGGIAIASGQTCWIVDGLLNFDPGTTSGDGIFRCDTVTIQGGVTLTPTSADFMMDDATTLDDLDNGGTLIASLTGNRITGTVTTQAGSEIRVDSTPRNLSTDLTIDSGFTNNGNIVLLHNTLTNNRDDRLTVTSGTLVNAAGGIITSALGTNRGTRTLTAQLDNEGTINVEYPLTLNGDSADHTNGGTINVNRDLTVQQTGTTPSFLHTGGIAIASGQTCWIVDGLLNFDPGTTSGDGIFRCDTVTIQGGVTLTPTSADFMLDDATTLDDLDNGGNLIASLTGNRITGTVTTQAGSEIRVDSTPRNLSTDLTVDSGFTNNGNIVLVHSTLTGNRDDRLIVTNGTLLNAAGGIITSALGTNRGTRTLTAQLDNEGTINVEYPLTINGDSADHTNGGTINVNRDLIVQQTGTTPSFIHTGGIAITTGQTCWIVDGLLNFDPGTTSGDGIFRCDTVTIQGGVTLTPTSANFMMDDATTLDDLDNGGTLIASLTGNLITGSVTTQPGSEIRVDSTPRDLSTDLTIDSGFTNNGNIVLLHNTLTNNRDDRLTVTNGTLLNAAGGIITSALGTNRGTRTLTAQLDNQGTINVEYPLTLNGDSADHTNGGTINVNRDLTVQQTGTTPSFLHTGGIAIASGQTCWIVDGLLNFDPGTTSGDGLFRCDTVTIQGGVTLTPTSADFMLDDATTLDDLNNGGTLIASLTGNRITGTVTTQPGSEIRVDSTPRDLSTDLTIDDGFTNNGNIVLLHNTLTNNRDDRLIVTNGTLLNAAGGIITSALGTNRGTRTLTAQLDNQGTINVEYPLILNGDSADHTNGGTINVNRDLTVQQTGTTPSFVHTGGIAIASGQTCWIVDGLLNFDPGTTSGDGIFRCDTVDIQGGVTLTPTSADFMLDDVTIVDDVDNGGVLIASLLGNTITGKLTTQPGSTLRIDSTPRNASTELIVADSFINHGDIILTHDTLTNNRDSRLEVVQGSLVNATDGKIQSALQTNRGTRTLTAELINQGEVNVDYPLLINKPDAGHTNTGIIRVDRNLTVEQTGPNATFKNVGEIAIASAQTCLIQDGGLFYDPGFTSGDGTLRCETVDVRGVTLTPTSADLMLDDGAIIDNLDNQGVLIATDLGNRITGNVTSRPGSTIRVDSTPSNVSSELIVDFGFVNRGAIALLHDTLTNNRDDRFEVSQGVLVNDPDGSILSEQGTNRGSRTLVAEVINRGLVRVDYALTVQGGPVLNDTAGKLEGDATLDLSAVVFVDDGITSPGLSPGVLTITGDDARSNTSALNVEIGGPAPGIQHDQLAVSGQAILDGALNVNLINGFQPILGQDFVILTAGTRTGTFSGLSGLTTPNGLQFDVQYEPTLVRLVTAPPANNNPPVAVNDSTSTAEDAAVNVDVVINDFDADGDSISVVPGAFSDPPHGTASLDSDGTVLYVPDLHFAGVDSFTYVISDQRGGNDTAQVHVEVLPVNDPPFFTTPTPPSVPAVTAIPTTLVQFDVRADDVDAGDILTLTVAGLPTGSAMAPALPTSGLPVVSTFSWTPTILDAGIHVMTFTVQDQAGEQATREVTVVVDPTVPVLVSQFDVIPGEDGIVIQWEFAEGSAVERSSVERSSSPLGPWKNLAMEPRQEGGRFFLLDSGVKDGLTYHYRLVAEESGTRWTFGPISAVASRSTLLSLAAPTPNPSRDHIRLDFALPRAMHVRIAVFDLQGRRVTTLEERALAAGRHSVRWDGHRENRRVPAGVYFIHLEAEGRRLVRRATLLR